MMELREKLAEAMRKAASKWVEKDRDARDPYFMHLSDAAVQVIAEWLESEDAPVYPLAKVSYRIEAIKPHEGDVIRPNVDAEVEKNYRRHAVNVRSALAALSRTLRGE